MRIPEGEEKEKGTESLFKEIMAGNFQNLRKKMDIYTHEAQRTLNRLNVNKATQRHTRIKLSKTKKELRAARVKREVTYLWEPARL